MIPLDEDDPQPTIFRSGARALEEVSVPDALGHYLVTIGDIEPGKCVEITAEPLTIGRGARQTLVFDDTEVSRVHARVSLRNGEAVVEDLGSTNGTFVDADRIAGPMTLREGSVLWVGHHALRYERRGRRDVERTLDLDRDLRHASNYVLSLLPPPMTIGPVRAEWLHRPSAHLGGDAFGYYWLDAETLVFYLIDVAGHGVGAAMHSVAVLNVLRQRALPQVDFRNPSEVLASLNDRFQMDDHHEMFFTMWYGVYSPRERVLSYGCAGHHPAYLVPPDRSAAQALGKPALMIGVTPGNAYDVHQAAVPAGGVLYLFSDGVFEIVTSSRQQWRLSDFLPLLIAPTDPGASEVERLYRSVRQTAAAGPLDDDCSLLVLTFT